jgi:hypothetical protein
MPARGVSDGPAARFGGTYTTDTEILEGDWVIRYARLDWVYELRRFALAQKFATTQAKPRAISLSL